MEALNRYWSTHPPVHVALKPIAEFCGVKFRTPESQSTDLTGQQAMADLKRFFPDGVIR